MQQDCKTALLLLLLDLTVACTLFKFIANHKATVPLFTTGLKWTK